MAIVKAVVAVPDSMEVMITITATLRELKDYTRENPPSHAVAHRLTDAIHAVRKKLTDSVEEVVSCG